MRVSTHWTSGFVISLGFAAALAPPRAADASYAFYVGNNLTADGSVLVGGTGEEVSSHWLETVPHRKHERGSTIRVGVTAEANIPGELIDIPQVPVTYRHLTMNYTDYKGFPPPLTNGGLNEFQVAVRDVWSPSRDELIEMTPTPQRGPNYSDLARIALERATTAREAVEIAGRLIDEHGYSTYGGNSHLFADPDEGWVMIELAGGRGLWAAERLGPDDVRVSYPGYIGEIPRDYQQHPDYMGSDNLISFAVEQGWYDPGAGEPFHFHRVYGAQGVPMRAHDIKYVNPEVLEGELESLAPGITVRDLMRFVRDPRIADDEAGYGQVAHLQQDLPHPDLATLWVAPTGSVTAPFIPYRIGVTEVAPEYRQHRYLTRNAASTFLHPDYQLQEATRFAGRVFKRLMYYTCERPDVFLAEVTETLEAFESEMLEEKALVDETARRLYEGGDATLGRNYLTRYSTTQAGEGLRLGEALLGSIEARTKYIYGIREPKGDDINTMRYETVNCRTSAGDVPHAISCSVMCAVGCRQRADETPWSTR